MRLKHMPRSHFPLSAQYSPYSFIKAPSHPPRNGDRDGAFKLDSNINGFSATVKRNLETSVVPYSIK